MMGAFNTPSDFNHWSTWNSMKDFFKVLDKVRESRWEEALNFNDEDDTDGHINESLLSAYRVDFYLSSSPTRSTSEAY